MLEEGLGKELEEELEEELKEELDELENPGGECTESGEEISLSADGVFTCTAFSNSLASA
jgi:hypothetical protein